MTYVYNESELASWTGDTDLHIMTNFTITDASFYPITITSAVNIYGNNKTLTFSSDVSDFSGLFLPQNGYTFNINVVGLNLYFIGPTITPYGAGCIFGDCTSSGTDGTMILSLCSATGNISVFGNGGCLIGNGCNCNINNCYSNATLGRLGGGGLVGGNSFGLIKNSFYTGNIVESFCGGICGAYSNCTINNCYFIGNINGDKAGGITGFAFAGTINNCYMIGDIYSQGGSLCGWLFEGTANNCYFVGSIASGAGAFLGVDCTGTINNCYAPSAVGNGIGDQQLVYSGTTTINTSGSQFGGTWDSSIAFNYLQNDFGSFNNIWADNDGNSPPNPGYNSPFLLTSFTVTPPWSHTSYDSVEGFDFTVICILEKTQILTDKGYKYIEDLKKGDNLITHTGKYKPIFKIGYRNYNSNYPEDVRRFDTKIYGHLPFEDLYVTKMHALLFENVNEYCNEFYVKNDDMIGKYHKVIASQCKDSCIPSSGELENRKRYYNIVLRDTDSNSQYGIYANGLLIETCSLNTFNEIKFLTKSNF